MKNQSALPFRSPLSEYERQAVALFEALQAGDESARWRVKWEHPLFQGKHVAEVAGAHLELADARLVVAHDHGFKTWDDLAEFTGAVQIDGPVSFFEEAVEAVVAGEAETLSAMLAHRPELAKQRSSRRHRATLLHYVAANGVEGLRQRTPANAVEIAKILLDAGAEVDALADMYGAKCTTLSMLLSSSHPAEAGLQPALAEALLDYGANLDGPGTKWRSALMTALAFGFLETAKVLVRRGARPTDLVAAAGLGRVVETRDLLAAADGASRWGALAMAAQHGHAEVVRTLLDAGEDPDRFNPEGFHSHSTPLHQAVWGNHLEVVQLLVERGARLDLTDKVYDGTPLDWAVYGGRQMVAEYLRSKNAPAN